MIYLFPFSIVRQYFVLYPNTVSNVMIVNWRGKCNSNIILLREIIITVNFEM